jgi:hypothetical protein
MSTTPGLKAALKRGALIAAANWPLVIVQFVAESSLKLLLAVPIVGGAFLVVLLLDTSLTELLSGDVRDIVTAIIAALTANPGALIAFLASALLVLVGGSMLTFVVKGGTVAVLAQAERIAAPIEKPPLRLDPLRRASVVSIDAFLDGCMRLWRRYVRVGLGLLIIYGLTAGAYLAFVLGGYELAESPALMLGWTALAALASSALIVWITVVNFFYLMTQMVIAIEDVSVRTGVRLALRFVWGHLREVAAVFGVVLVIVIIATAASLLATAGLSLIAFVPLVGLGALNRYRNVPRFEREGPRPLLRSVVGELALAVVAERTRQCQQVGGVVAVVAGERVALGLDRLAEQLADLLQGAVEPVVALQARPAPPDLPRQVVEPAPLADAAPQQLLQRRARRGALHDVAADLVQRCAEVDRRGERIGPVGVGAVGVPASASLHVSTLRR